MEQAVLRFHLCFSVLFSGRLYSSAISWLLVSRERALDRSRVWLAGLSSIDCLLCSPFHMIPLNHRHRYFFSFLSIKSSFVIPSPHAKESQDSVMITGVGHNGALRGKRGERGQETEKTHKGITGCCSLDSLSQFKYPLLLPFTLTYTHTHIHTYLGYPPIYSILSLLPTN
ncbi:hypothetical protein B0H63DRAFT_113243 [Podospora didyma]|uniref:Uncharacterized protein n=1 Tax=Podospora didyma TaxID=330526 RepID=A0AAE0NZ86_9PEZI|nr:hypothetical protein B0H63DRAFT_113243 [Podospora didyma]